MSPTDPPTKPSVPPESREENPRALLDEARAALRWAVWTGADAIEFERFTDFEMSSPAPVTQNASPASRDRTSLPRTSVPSAALPPHRGASPDVRQRPQRLSPRPSLKTRLTNPAARSTPAPSTAQPKTPAAPSRSAAERAARITRLHARIGDCERCELSRNRRHIVHGVGPLDARLLFVGSGPFADDDGAGQPFAGEDGVLFDRMLGAMGLRRAEVYVTGLVRCHLSSLGNLSRDALAQCTPFLRTELDTVQPEVVVLMGDAASRFLLRQPGVAVARGRWHTLLGIPTIATWGLPILRQQPRRKGDVWQDLQTVMARLGLQKSPV